MTRLLVRNLPPEIVIALKRRAVALSEIRKKQNANKGVRKFFERVIAGNGQIYVSVITLGELRRGVELIRHRGDAQRRECASRFPGRE